MEIVYHGHSGFSVRTKGLFLIFDYIGNDLALPNDGGRIYAFVSHAHGDHYGKQIKKWKSERAVKLIGGHDVRNADISLRPGECFSEGALNVFAYPSTDAGVSFLVQAEGASIFHAGDLNLWHWKDESTQEEIHEAEVQFEDALKTLDGVSIDVAFFPVDPRLGTDYDEGARRFARAIRPKLLIPMHFTSDINAALNFSRLQMPGGVEVRMMTSIGEKLKW